MSSPAQNPGDPAASDSELHSARDLALDVKDIAKDLGSLVRAEFQLNRLLLTRLATLGAMAAAFAASAFALAHVLLIALLALAIGFSTAVLLVLALDGVAIWVLCQSLREGSARLGFAQLQAAFGVLWTMLREEPGSESRDFNGLNERRAT